MMITPSTLLRATTMMIAVGTPAITLGHVTVISGPVAESTDTSTSRVVVRFGIPHGCRPLPDDPNDPNEEPKPNQDTYKVRVTIPDALATVGVRAVAGVFGGTGTLIKEDNQVKAVVWERADEVADTDDYYYSAAIRFSVPTGMKFGSLYFPTYQHCRAPGEQTGIVSAWVQQAEHDHGAHNVVTADDDMSMDQVGDIIDGDTVVRIAESPKLLILPVRKPGWNKFSTGDDQHLHGSKLLGQLFGDAEIVWSGSKAYSSNPTTMQLIEEDEDVEVLEEIHNNSEIWVKY